MAVVATMRKLPTAGILAVGPIPVAVSIITAISASMVTVSVRMVAVAVSIDRPAWRGHDHRRRTMARYHHDGRGVTKNHPRKWRQRNANVNVNSCL